eukprot:Rmarinus@m.7918
MRRVKQFQKQRLQKQKEKVHERERYEDTVRDAIHDAVSLNPYDENQTLDDLSKDHPVAEYAGRDRLELLRLAALSESDEETPVYRVKRSPDVDKPTQDTSSFKSKSGDNSATDVFERYLNQTEVLSSVENVLQNLLRRDFLPVNPFPYIINKIRLMEFRMRLFDFTDDQSIENFVLNDVALPDRTLPVAHVRGNYEAWGLRETMRFVTPSILNWLRTLLEALGRFEEKRDKSYWINIISALVSPTTFYGRFLPGVASEDLGASPLIVKEEQVREKPAGPIVIREIYMIEGSSMEGAAHMFATDILSHAAGIHGTGHSRVLGIFVYLHGPHAPQEGRKNAEGPTGLSDCFRRHDVTKIKDSNARAAMVSDIRACALSGRLVSLKILTAIPSEAETFLSHSASPARESTIVNVEKQFEFHYRSETQEEWDNYTTFAFQALLSGGLFAERNDALTYCHLYSSASASLSSFDHDAPISFKRQVATDIAAKYAIGDMLGVFRAYLPFAITTGRRSLVSSLHRMFSSPAAAYQYFVDRLDALLLACTTNLFEEDVSSPNRTASVNMFAGIPPDFMSLTEKTIEEIRTFIHPLNAVQNRNNVWAAISSGSTEVVSITPVILNWLSTFSGFLKDPNTTKANVCQELCKNLRKGIILLRALSYYYAENIASNCLDVLNGIRELFEICPEASSLIVGASHAPWIFDYLPGFPDPQALYVPVAAEQAHRRRKYPTSGTRTGLLAQYCADTGIDACLTELIEEMACQVLPPNPFHVLAHALRVAAFRADIAHVASNQENFTVNDNSDTRLNDTMETGSHKLDKETGKFFSSSLFGGSRSLHKPILFPGPKSIGGFSNAPGTFRGWQLPEGVLSMETSSIGCETSVLCYSPVPPIQARTVKCRKTFEGPDVFGTPAAMFLLNVTNFWQLWPALKLLVNNVSSSMGNYEVEAVTAFLCDGALCRYSPTINRIPDEAYGLPPPVYTSHYVESRPSATVGLSGTHENDFRGKSGVNNATHSGVTESMNLPPACVSVGVQNFPLLGVGRVVLRDEYFLHGRDFDRAFQLFFEAMVSHMKIAASHREILIKGIFSAGEMVTGMQEFHDDEMIENIKFTLKSAVQSGLPLAIEAFVFLNGGLVPVRKDISLRFASNDDHFEGMGNQDECILARCVFLEAFHVNTFVKGGCGASYCHLRTAVDDGLSACFRHGDTIKTYHWLAVRRALDFLSDAPSSLHESNSNFCRNKVEIDSALFMMGHSFAMSVKLLEDGAFTLTSITEMHRELGAKCGLDSGQLEAYARTLCTYVRKTLESDCNVVFTSLRKAIYAYLRGMFDDNQHFVFLRNETLEALEDAVQLLRCLRHSAAYVVYSSHPFVVDLITELTCSFGEVQSSPVQSLEMLRND